MQIPFSALRYRESQRWLSHETLAHRDWAYMVMASLAWTLKAWMALSLPISPRWREKHRAERDAWLRMEFRTFLHAVINVPAQVVTTGRRLIIRLLAWRPQLHVLMRLADAT